jgi:hypothetical protein
VIWLAKRVGPAFLMVAGLILLLATALLIASLFGCAHAPTAPSGNLPAAGLKRLYRVADGVYRSEQPSAAQFAELQRLYGIRSVVKLNTALPGDGGHDALAPGMELADDPLLPAGPVSHEDLIDALDDVDTAPKPVLVHCAHGEDRTGLVVGLYRVRHGSMVQAAWSEMLVYGFHDDLIGLTEAFRREVGWR